MDNRTTARKPDVTVPVIIYDANVADGMDAQHHGDGILRLRPGLDLEEVLEAIHDGVLAMNGRRTPRTIPAGFEERPDGTVRPRLAVHEGGGHPDRRRSRRPQLTSVPDEGENR